MLGIFFSKKKFLERDFRSPFECGFSTLNESQRVFSVRFFVIALVFLVFDIELILIFPYLLINIFEFNSIFIFILLINFLRVGLFYE